MHPVSEMNRRITKIEVECNFNAEMDREKGFKAALWRHSFLLIGLALS